MKRMASAFIGCALIVYAAVPLRAEGQTAASYDSYGSINVATTPVPGSNIYLDFVFDTGLDTNATVGAVASGS
ncbi:MAG: hypothetical protein WCP22_07975, partial [Chlamydiota bacterium]